MATFVRRGEKWRVLVRRVGRKTISKTFTTKAQGESWARSIEHEIDYGGAPARPKGTLGELFQRYITEVSDEKPSGRWEAIRLRKLDREIGETRLDTDLTKTLLEWRNKRLKLIKPASVRREMVVMSAVFTYARKEWRMTLKNPLKEMTWPSDSRPRTRRISLVEEQQLLDKMGFDWAVPPTTLKSYTPWVFLFALETAMRLGEILTLEWSQVAEKWVTLDKTKNGDSRAVPLSSRARQIIATMPKVGSRVFMVQPGTFDNNWRAVRPPGLHFHDTRATALSRLAPKFQPMELAKISGHRDLNMLLNTYYRPTPDELADRLD